MNFKYGTEIPNKYFSNLDLFMKEEAIEHKVLNKNKAEELGKKERWVSTVGLLILPFLFGTNLTSLQMIEKQKDVSGKILLHSESWTYISSALFIGAFLFSLSLFICGLLNMPVHSRFKEIFVISSLFIFFSNIVLAFFSNVVLLSISRFLAGISFGAVCGVCMVYYMYIHSDAIGKKICAVHSLLICVGVMSLNTIYMLAGEENTWKIFVGIAVISLIPMGASMGFVKNVKEDKKKIEVILMPNGEDRDKDPQYNIHSVLMTGACILIHVFQQMTGINPMLVNQNLFIFSENTQSQWKSAAKTFFNFSGLLGGIISVALVSRFPRKMPIFILYSSCLTAFAYVPFVFKHTWLKWWGGGLYYMGFSIMLSGLPWILPSILLENEKNVSLAAGLGALFNWMVSFLLIFKSRDMSDLMGVWIYVLFMGFTLLEGVLGWWLVRGAEIKKKALLPKNEIRKGVRSVLIPPVE